MMEFALVDAAASKKQKRRKRVGFEGGNFVFCDSDADRKVRTNRIVYDIYTSIYTIYAIYASIYTIYASIYTSIYTIYASIYTSISTIYASI